MLFKPLGPNVLELHTKYGELVVSMDHMAKWPVTIEATLYPFERGVMRTHHSTERPFTKKEIMSYHLAEPLITKIDYNIPLARIIKCYFDTRQKTKLPLEGWMFMSTRLDYLFWVYMWAMSGEQAPPEPEGQQDRHTEE